MSNSINIKFDNPSAIYFPSQIVSGSVELIVTETIKKARGLRLIVEGEAKCEWSESSGSGNSRRSTTYSGKEKYLNSLTYLFGSKDGESVEVPIGIHTYTFACQLPIPIPASVEGKHGSIRYNVDVNLDIPWAFDLHESLAFTVVRYEDLNFFPELKLGTQAEELKYFCCWCCQSNPIIIKISIPKQGFALGEKIPVTIDLINKSTTNCYESNLSLKRVDSFKSQDPRVKTKVAEETVMGQTSRGVAAGETVSFTENIDIPQILMISNHRYCEVFQINYIVKFTAETEGCTTSPDVYLPITIGSVGLLPEENKLLKPEVPPYSEQ